MGGAGERKGQLQDLHGGGGGGGGAADQGGIFLSLPGVLLWLSGGSKKTPSAALLAAPNC